MNFEPSERCQDFRERLTAFMDERIYPSEELYEHQLRDAGDPHAQPAIMEELKEEARRAACGTCSTRPAVRRRADERRVRAAGRDHGPQPPRPGGVNCSAPDTGNMEVLTQFGTEEQQDRWLRPLLDGEIRSRVRDDRAGRRELATRRTCSCASTATATATSSTAASGGRRTRCTRTAGS